MSRPRLIPTASVAIALGVKEEAVRKMAQRGQLTRYGTARRAAYDVAEVIAIRKGLGGRLDAARPASLPCI